MEENIQAYYPLGKKTLFMLILRKSGILVFFLLLLVVALFFFSYVPSEYVGIATNAVLVCIAIWLVMLAAIIMIGWLLYFRYGIYIGDKHLSIKKGFIATEEIGIPYKRLRDVKLKRSLLDQILGVSDIILVLSDFEEEQSKNEESIIFLPSLEKNMAMEIKDSILKKSQVEQINVLAGQNIVSPS